MRLLWASHSFRNGYGIRMHTKFPITTATMSYLLPQIINTISNKRGRLVVFLELVPSTRTRELNVPFKLLCIWLVCLWCILCCVFLKRGSNDLSLWYFAVNH